MQSVEIVEVGPRDGFQAIGPFINTDIKIDIIKGLVDAGLGRVEIGSFVSPKALPQMRDIVEIYGAVKDMPTEMSVLVPNLKGAELALAAGMDNLVYVMSASEAHNQSNVRCSIKASLDELGTILLKLRPAGRFRLNIATAFHCPFTGMVDLDSVLPLLHQAIEWRPDIEIALCDTTGRATPELVSEAFNICARRFADPVWAYHAHDTYGTGIATVTAAYQAGVRVIDASIAGLGGCPFAPGASGNVATEDIVFMFERAGVETGIDLERLLQVMRTAQQIDGADVPRRLHAAASGPSGCAPQS